MQANNYRVDITFYSTCKNARDDGNTEQCLQLIDMHHNEKSKYINDHAFLIACEFGLINVVKYLLDKFEIKFYVNSYQAFRVASKNGYLKIIKILMNLNHRYLQKKYHNFIEYEFEQACRVLSETCYNYGVTKNGYTQNSNIDVTNHLGIVKYIFDNYIF